MMFSRQTRDLNVCVRVRVLYLECVCGRRLRYSQNIRYWPESRGRSNIDNHLNAIRIDFSVKTFVFFLYRSE